MGIKKIKIEVEDDRGCRYTFSITHPIRREKIAQFIDLVEMMSGPINAETFKVVEDLHTSIRDKSKFEKIIEIIKEKFPLNWFSSSEVQLAYEEKFREPISLSTVSTYLSRCCDKGFLIREGPPNMLKYRVKVGTIVKNG